LVAFVCQMGVYGQPYRDKKVVRCVFVRFSCTWLVGSISEFITIGLSFMKIAPVDLAECFVLFISRRSIVFSPVLVI
jgi:hypothetical protein